MTNFKEIIATLKQTDNTKAELWEEEIDTIVHKLKFLTQESIPTVALIDQNKNFQIIDSSLLQEKVKIAGGLPSAEFNENIAIFIILQKDESLYSQLPSFIAEHQNTKAVVNNNIFIINSDSFNSGDESYLLDIEILAEIIQSKYFVFGHNGTTWLKFDLS